MITVRDATIDDGTSIADRDMWRCGIGRVMMEGLVERARAAAVHVLVGAIDSGNDASLRFHARLGFAEVALMPEVGHKCGRWLDLVLIQRVLDERTIP